jgi:hypothetical protein
MIVICRYSVSADAFVQKTLMHLRSRAPAATGTGERGRSVDWFITKLSRKKSSRYKSSL